MSPSAKTKPSATSPSLDEIETIAQAASIRQATDLIYLKRRRLRGPRGLAAAIVAQAAIDYLAAGPNSAEAKQFLESPDCRFLVENVCDYHPDWPQTLKKLAEHTF